MKSAKVALTVLVLFSFLVPPQSAHADMAPPPAPGLGGLRPFQYQTTEVQMVYERVELTIEASTNTSEPEWAQENVSVTAWFVLHNTGSTDEEMKAAFPLNSLTLCDEKIDSPSSYGIGSSFIIPESFKAVVDGKEAQTQVTEIEGIDCVGWATFDVKFPVKKDVLVKIDYTMQTDGRGHNLILQYILETGAGWKGPIKQAYIIFRFPYLVTSGNIDFIETTPGYQSLYNEIFWSYRDLEPTPDDNITVAFFEPRAWARIQAWEDQVAKDPNDVNTWLKLFDEYAIGMPYNIDDISPTYELAIESNPDNADLYAKYAEYLLPRCCYHPRGDPTLPVGALEYAKRIISLVNQSLALDPHNETALYVLDTVRDTFPDIAYTPPATIPPTATSMFAATPSATLTATAMFIPEGPDEPVGTMVQAETVILPTSTSKPAPTTISAQTQVAVRDEDQNGTSAPLMIFGTLLIFAAGMGAGVFWQKRTGK